MCAGSCENILPAAYEVDHAVPLFCGGTDSPDNLQALCNNCHAEKSLHESAMRENPDKFGKLVLWCVWCRIYYSKFFRNSHMHEMTC